MLGTLLLDFVAQVGRLLSELLRERRCGLGELLSGEEGVNEDVRFCVRARLAPARLTD